MKVYGLPALAAILLTACSQGEAPPEPKPSLAATDAPPAIPVMGPERRIIAFGDSLFAGYGLNAGEGYPAMLEAALRAQGINARLIDGAVSGDTTAAGLQRLAFLLDSQPDKPELVLISLGGNDMLRGLSPQQTRENLDAILTELDKRGIRAVLMGMLAAPNLGADYRRAFDPIYPALAKKHDAALVPFFMQPLMDRPDRVLPDRIHPTATGVEAMVAATVDTVREALPPVAILPPVTSPPQ